MLLRRGINFMTLSSEADMQHLGIFWMLKLDGPVPPGAGLEPDIPATFLRAGPEIAGELAEAMMLDNPDNVLQRFALGRQCYLARVEGKIASYGWISFDEEGIGELGLILRLKKGDAYIWGCATLPPYRGQRLYPALLAHMLRELQRAGLERIWIGTDADNLPSQSGVAAVGFQPVVDVMLSQRKLLSQGRPGVPTQDVLDALYALFGNSDLIQTTLPETET
jgi:GNAT superfamily N-acetyltransferase